MSFYHDKFREMRKTNFISTKYLVRQLGISQPTLWYWETGKRTPDEKQIRLISEVTKFPLNAISDLKEEIKLSTSDINLKSMIEPVLFNSANINSVYHSIINVVEQLRIKSERSAHLMKVLLDSNNIIFSIKDTNFRYLAVNDIFLKTVNMPQDFNYMGKDDSAFFTQNECRIIRKTDEELLRTGKIIHSRKDYILGTRKKKIGLISKYPIFDESGMVMGIACTVIDITPQYKPQKRNDEIYELLTTFANAVNKAVSIFDIDSRRFLFVNPFIENIYNVKPEDFKDGGFNYFYMHLLHIHDRQLYDSYEDDIADFDRKHPLIKFRVVSKRNVVRFICRETTSIQNRGKCYSIYMDREITEDEYTRLSVPTADS